MPQQYFETLVEERLALLKEITERRNALLRQMFHMIRQGRTAGSVLTLDDEDGDLQTFLQKFELNKESTESGSILLLGEDEIPASEESAASFKSTSKGKPPIVRRTTRSRFRPQESSSSKPAQSLPRNTAMEASELGQAAEKTLSIGRPFLGVPHYHEDSDEGPDELDLLGSPSTSVLSTQFSKVIHVADSEPTVSAQESLRASPEDDARQSSGQGHGEESVQHGLDLGTDRDENAEGLGGDGQLAESDSPIIIDVDADVPTSMMSSGPASWLSRSTAPTKGAGLVIEEKRDMVFKEAPKLVSSADSFILPVGREEPSMSDSRHGAGPEIEHSTELPVEATSIADILRFSGRSPGPLRSRVDLPPDVSRRARRPVIILGADSSATSEPVFNFEGTLPGPLTPLQTPSPVQPRHQFQREYTLPSLRSLPLEYSRKVKSTKLQRKREKGREKNEGRKDKDGLRDDWYPWGLNRWAAVVSANPVWKRVSRASKCLSTREWAVAMSEVRLLRAHDRIEGLKREGRWGFRQPKKQRGVGGLNKTHFDYLIDEMKWMQVDFREERKWKMALAFDLSTAVLEWHAAGNLAERLEKGICIGGKRSRFQDDDSEQDGDVVGEQVKLGTEELLHPEQPKTSLLQVDYGSDEDEEDDESVVDQQIVLDTLDPAVLVEDALNAAQEDRSWAVTQDARPKEEGVEESILNGDGNANTLMVDEQDAMKVDVSALDIPQLKATSIDPILASNSASRNSDVELPTAQTKSSLKTSIYAPLRESIVYSNDDKLFLDTDDFHNLMDDALLPPSDLSSIFPDLQPFGLFDVSMTLAPSTNEGKKRSDKRSERDDPTKRSEDTTYTKLFPAGEFMYSKPTLLGPLYPAKYFKHNQWSSEESAVLPDSDSSARISDNVPSELFDSRSSNSPASIMALQLQTALLKERDPRKRGADHLWSTSDDILLKSLIDKYPNNWALISECFNASRLTISIDKRTPRDCLERWKEKWGSEIRHRPADSPMVTEDAPTASGQMTTRGVKRLASASVSTPSVIGVVSGSEPRKRRRHMLVQESIRKATKKRAESAQKVIANPRKSSAVHETHAQYNKMPKHTPAELSRMKAEKEGRDLQDLQMARRRQEELSRQAHRLNVPEQQQVAQQQLGMTTAQRTNGGIAQAQGVPQIRNQVNISQQQRTGTPLIGNARLSPQQFLQAQQQAQQLRAAQQAQQTQTQGQNSVSGNGPTNTNNAHLSTPRDIASSPAHVSPPHGPGLMSNAMNSPRPPSAQAHPLLQGPGNNASRPIGSYYSLAGMPEQLQNALRLQMQLQQQTPQTPPDLGRS